MNRIPLSDAVERARSEHYRTRRRPTHRPQATTYRRDEHEPRRPVTRKYDETDDALMVCDVCAQAESPLVVEGKTVTCQSCIDVLAEEVSDIQPDDDADATWITELMEPEPEWESL